MPTDLLAWPRTRLAIPSAREDVGQQEIARTASRNVALVHTLQKRLLVSESKRTPTIRSSPSKSKESTRPYEGSHAHVRNTFCSQLSETRRVLSTGEWIDKPQNSHEVEC